MSLSEIAYSALRRRIVAGEMKPGDRVREVELSDELGVSRTPVREAIKRLENEGFLSVVATKGLVVTELTQAHAIELYAAREVFEGTAASFAARYAQPSEIDMLETILEMQQKSQDDIKELVRLNRMFHSSIYQMAHNRYILGILNNSQDYMVLIKETAYNWKGRSETAYHEHKRIFEAIRDKDPIEAEAAARDHMREAQKIRLLLQVRS